MKLKGKVGRSDLEGGYFTFSVGKETYKLEGGDKELLQVGVSAELEGKIEGTMMGIGFGMPTFKVKSYKLG